MRKKKLISKMPKLKKDFYRYHKLFWNGIEDEVIREGRNIFNKYKDFSDIKSSVKHNIFDLDICFKLTNTCECFPCWYSNYDCIRCLLKCKNNNASFCLDEKFNSLRAYFLFKNYLEVLYHIDIIKNLPMR